MSPNLRLLHHGEIFTVEILRDEDHGPPWQEADGHGVVSDWTRRAKAPGERVLVEDRDHRRYYDIRATLAITVRDGWGVAGGRLDGESARAYAARAVEADYQYLRGWCQDDWWYVGVVVRLEDQTESLWGIESSNEAYHEVVAKELANEILARVERCATCGGLVVRTPARGDVTA